MPHLVEMDKKYGEKGLRILAPEVQGSPVAQIKALTEKYKIKYPIMKGTTRPASLNGIPHSVVFAPSGELVFAGHPMAAGFDKAIKAALEDVEEEKPAGGGLFAEPMIAERTWTNTEGKPLVASVTAINGDKVKFKLKNGQQVDYLIAKLSEDDQALIKEASPDSEEDER